MGIFKLLALGFLLWIGYKILRLLVRQFGGRAKQRPNEQVKQAHNAKMVCCKVCDVHVPLTDTTLIDGHYYCSKHTP